MAGLDPQTAIGLLRRAKSDVVVGTCFALRDDHVILTAAHCVPDDANGMTVLFPSRGYARPVLRADRHPTADIAVLVLSPPDPLPPRITEYPPERADKAFWNYGAPWQLGEEFMSYGYPVDAPPLGPAAESYIPRLYIGHYQRFFDYAPPGGYHYLAGEMSIAAPIGLSGAPLFRRNALVMVTGLVTTSIESFTVQDSSEEIDELGRVFRQETRRVVSYGTALMLSGVADWLEQVIPSIQ